MDFKRHFKNALISGTIVGIATGIAGSVYAMADRKNPVAPINAVSHIVWGKEAIRRDDVTLKYTGTGALLHYFSSIWWALVYESWFGRKAEKKGARNALKNGVIVSGLAYIVDYHLIPDRLSPGFETRLSKYSLPLMFGVIALTLPLRSIVKHRQSRNRFFR